MSTWGEMKLTLPVDILVLVLGSIKSTGNPVLNLPVLFDGTEIRISKASF